VHRRSYEDVKVADSSIRDWVAVSTTQAKFLPHTAGRYQVKRFHKAQVRHSCNFSLVNRGIVPSQRTCYPDARSVADVAKTLEY